ncbi:glycerol-3-phosphate acyltransferase 2, mitochondrial [Lampris incognitus]|uniref:glycerol-3-phosphate acyltransferase 2, mitochondrial n=1 Tax=Lampris incognitus TaxID=2546036 RepID=UPI0024B4D4BC|nr:glycerol-3-phosphate acyltransferase 2, mitochondrial [Lampris incognitus]
MKTDGVSKEVSPPPTQYRKPALSWGVKIKPKLEIIPPYLGKYRPRVGQCCHQCTPDSLNKKLGKNSPSLGLQSILNINETHTRYRGWLVRRVCCVLFVRGCKVYPSPVRDRLARVCQSNRVQDALTAEHTAPVQGDSQEQLKQLSAYLPLINTSISAGFLRCLGWVMLKTLRSVFCSIQVNLNHIRALHQASEQGSLLMYVCMRQSIMDCALLSLVLFCHKLRVPYTLCSLQINSSLLRSVLRKVGVVPLPPGTPTEQDAEMDGLYSPVMTSLVGELLCEGQAISVSVACKSGQGGQWLARVRQLVKEGAVSDVCLVPVGIAYDCVPNNLEVSLKSALLSLWSLLCGRSRSGSVRIHLAEPFSLKEMCETGRRRMDGWRPLQDLLLPAILNNRRDAILGQRKMSWLLPCHYVPELVQSERDLSVALTLHLIHSTTSCMAVMSTSLVSSLLLHRHRKGVCVSALCRDVSWLIEEVLFRNKDVGFGGSLVELVHHSLTLLTPHLTIVAVPSRRDPLIVIRPTIPAIRSLSNHAQIVTHTFILEAVGACAVSAMLSEVAGRGVSGRVRRDGVEGDEVKGSLEFDVVLCQEELTEKALQLCHLLPPGFKPPCQSSQDFAVDAFDSLVRCGVLIMEEVPDDPVCDFWKRNNSVFWLSTDNQYNSDSEYEKQSTQSYKISQPSNCPEMLFYLCSMLASYLRALRWATEGLDLLHKPLPEAECVAQLHSYLHDLAKKEKDSRYYESCTEEMARTAVRTLADLGVLVVEQRGHEVALGVSPLFQLADNRQKLHRFISQYICN